MKTLSEQVAEDRVREMAAEYARGFEAGRKDADADWVEGAAALQGTCRDLSGMLAACRARLEESEAELANTLAKLARVEAVLFADWCQAAGYVERADDFGRLHAYVRAALADSGEKPTDKLAWFEKREPMVRALVGAVEDCMLAELAEWRVLVDWEMENKS